MCTVYHQKPHFIFSLGYLGSKENLNSHVFEKATDQVSDLKLFGPVAS